MSVCPREAPPQRSRSVAEILAQHAERSEWARRGDARGLRSGDIPFLPSISTPVCQPLSIQRRGDSLGPSSTSVCSSFPSGNTLISPGRVVPGSRYRRPHISRPHVRPILALLNFETLVSACLREARHPLQHQTLHVVVGAQRRSRASGQSPTDPQQAPILRRSSCLPQMAGIRNIRWYPVTAIWGRTGGGRTPKPYAPPRFS